MLIVPQGNGVERIRQAINRTRRRIREFRHRSKPRNHISNDGDDGCLPSWVPDWRVWTDDSDYLFLAKKSDCHYQASLTSRPEVTFDSSRRILNVHGIVFDTIRAASTADPSASSDPESIAFATKAFWDMWQSIRPQEVPYGDADSQALAFENAFFAGRGAEWITQPAMTRNLMRLADGEDDDDGNASAAAHGLVPQYFGEDVGDGNRVMLTRQFFVTERGYMGYGQKGLDIGDVVVVFLGAKVPFVLRPSGDYFLLRGDCCEFVLCHREVAS